MCFVAPRSASVNAQSTTPLSTYYSQSSVNLPDKINSIELLEYHRVHRAALTDVTLGPVFKHNNRAFYLSH